MIPKERRVGQDDLNRLRLEANRVVDFSVQEMGKTATMKTKPEGKIIVKTECPNVFDAVRKNLEGYSDIHLQKEKTLNGVKLKALECGKFIYTPK